MAGISNTNPDECTSLGGNVFGSSSRGVGQGVPSAGSAAPFMSMFSGTNDVSACMCVLERK